MRHVVPNGDPAVIFDRAMSVLLKDLEKKTLGRTERPRTTPETKRRRSRHVAASVKREVWQRDGGRCAFVGSEGRCRESAFLELHHVIPYADGGKTDTSNLQLRCRAHNAHEAKEWFG